MTPADRQILEARANDHRVRAGMFRSQGRDSLAEKLDAEADHIHNLCERL